MEPVVRRAFVPTVAFYEELDEGPVGEFYRRLRRLTEAMVSEVNPDVKAQMDRIHRATNDGTFDKESINDALARLWDFLTGAAYEVHEAEVEGEEAGEGEEEHPHARKPRKKR